MSKVSHLLSAVTSILGLSPAKAPALPTPAIAAAPAPTQNNDTGATIQVGNTNNNGTDRISAPNKKRKVGDVLGGLGQSSGLNV